MYRRVNELLGTDFKSNDEIEWYNLPKQFNLSESFIREFKDHVNWIRISSCQILSWDFILEFKDYVDWYYISTRQPFIDNPNYERIKKDYLKYNKFYQLYQETKDKGWFIGYISPNGIQFNLECNLSYPKKAKIYWKDLGSLINVKIYKFIREVKRI